MSNKIRIRWNATEIVELRYPGGAVADVVSCLLKEDVMLMVDMIYLDIKTMKVLIFFPNIKRPPQIKTR